MRSDVPAEIKNTVHELNAEALVTLFEIVLKDGTEIRISPKDREVWQGDIYDALPCSLVGVGRSSDGTASRPKFTFVNPASLFTQDLYSGRLNNAALTRIRILRPNLTADTNVAIRERFRVSRVLNMSKDLASLELRDLLDGQGFRLPARQFIPPEFPHVRIE